MASATAMAWITSSATITRPTVTIIIAGTTTDTTRAITTGITRRNTGSVTTDTTTRANIAATSATVTMMIMAIGDMTATGAMENWSVTGETGITTIGVAGTGTGTMAASATNPEPVFAILGQRDARYPLPGWQLLLAGLFPGAAMSSGDAALAAAQVDIREANPGTGLAVQDNEQNNQALEEFFASSEENAFYVAYAALWNRETAMDVVQESMLRLIEYYRDKPAGQWPALFRTILNSRINDVRRRRMLEQGKHKLISLTGLFHKEQDERHAMDEYEIPSEQRTDGITAPEVAAVTTELRHKVETALQALSERQRQVFILREWRGMTIRETSETLGCSENSVKQHHFRAMRELRKQLAEVWEHA